VSGSPVGRRRGIGPVDLAVFLACVLAVLLAGPVDDAPPADEPAPPPQAAATPAPQLLAAPVLDADGVQRRLTAAQPAIALTFDDGPDPRWTPTVLDLLRQHHVTATFCLVGQHVAEHPELVRRIAAEGHAVCNHTWTHDEALQRRSRAEVRDELERTSRAITAASGGTEPRYFRAPAGNWAPVAVAEARRLGLTLLGWSVDPLDWRRPPAAEIARRVLTRAGPGRIVLLHDGYGSRAGTVAALRTILPMLAARNLRFVTP
jgi:peptidoglycan/xylan/chitin deacetylase (PgdA/CDA1 family)